MKKILVNLVIRMHTAGQINVIVEKASLVTARHAKSTLVQHVTKMRFVTPAQTSFVFVIQALSATVENVI